MSSVVSGVSSVGSTSTVGKETVVEVEVKKVVGGNHAGGVAGANPGVTLARLTGCILYVRNLPFNMKTEAIVDIFEKFGTVVQLHLGDVEGLTKGSAFVVFSTPQEAKKALNTLKGYKVEGRYLVITPYDPKRMKTRIEEQISNAQEAAKKEKKRKRSNDQ